MPIFSKRRLYYLEDDSRHLEDKRRIYFYKDMTDQDVDDFSLYIRNGEIKLLVVKRVL